MSSVFTTGFKDQSFTLIADDFLSKPDTLLQIVCLNPVHRSRKRSSKDIPSLALVALWSPRTPTQVDRDARAATSTLSLQAPGPP